jgi:hypothetical protein
VRIPRFVATNDYVPEGAVHKETADARGRRYSLAVRASSVGATLRTNHTAKDVGGSVEAPSRLSVVDTQNGWPRLLVHDQRPAAQCEAACSTNL